ncbi:hypothetical protein [Candidatus Entotheonella palauensis]|uniref:hypothetical protein n=1 Tax=Candidatus Entotheonella palauensis TaxID=93172 RepID=UPI000B7D86F9|nr:hypothetical protein [Candidatus Entotheonella palauensis]
MMRFRIVLGLCLVMLASLAYAELPTKTIAQGGWFAVGGPGQMSDMLCGGGPCTDQAFANFFGSFVSNIPVGATDLYESREKAISGLKDGDFSLNGDVCLPSDMGQPGALVSGFVRYYTLNDFTYEQLSQASPIPGTDSRITEIIQAIFMRLTDLNLDNLAMIGSTQLMSPEDGQPVDPFAYQAAFAEIDLRGYELIARWADTNDAVVNGMRVNNLQTTNFTCP